MSISIHALREEGDKKPLDGDIIGVSFLSTPSARRATYCLPATLILYDNFYPRPPRGGRLCCRRMLASGRDFYPRPPRGGRLRAIFAAMLLSYFYPRPPRGGRRSGSSSFSSAGYFYPRPPRGGRLITSQISMP